MTTRPLLAGLALRRAPARARVAVDGVDLTLGAGERVGVVGASGAGKSTLLQLLLRLQDADGGAVLFDGVDVTRARGRALAALRRGVQPVFQDPGTSLHPLWSAERIVAEGLRVHGLHEGSEAARVRTLLGDVGLDAEVALRRAQELSGGQRQRVAIARALAVEPRALLLDEPLAALDPTVAAQVLNVLKDLSTTRGLALLLVSHDLRVVRHACRRVVVLLAGRVVEEGPVALLDAPAHPYTQALVQAARLAPDVASPGARAHGLPALPAEASAARPAPWQGRCAFVARCPAATAVCQQHAPVLVSIGDERRVACFAVPGARDGGPAVPAEERRSSGR